MFVVRSVLLKTVLCTYLDPLPHPRFCPRLTSRALLPSLSEDPGSSWSSPRLCQLLGNSCISTDHTLYALGPQLCSLTSTTPTPSQKFLLDHSPPLSVQSPNSLGPRSPCVACFLQLCYPFFR